MNWFKQLFSRRRLYDDLSEEIQAHLEEKIEELVAGGMTGGPDVSPWTIMGAPSSMLEGGAF
jgi:hypothetical protein